MPSRSFVRLLEKAEPRRPLLFLNAALAPLIAALEVASFSLLVPILQIAAFRSSEETLRDFPYFFFLKKFFPGFFSLENFGVAILCVVAAVTGKLTLQYASGVSVFKESRRIEMNLRVALFDHALSLGPSFSDERPIGGTRWHLLDLPSCLTRGLDILRSSLIQLCTGLSYLAVLFFLSWRLTILTLLFLLAVFLALRYFQKKIAGFSEKTLRNSAEKEAFATDRLANLKLVKACGTEDRESGRFRQMESRLTNALIKREDWSGLVTPLQEWFATAAIAILLFLGFCLSPEQDASHLFPLLLSALLWKRAASLLVNLNANRLQWFAVEAAADKLSKFLDSSRRSVIESGSKKFDGLAVGGIEFRGVSMSYDGQKEVLKDVSLEIKKGDVVIIAGPSGAGKTTFVELIPRFYEFQKGRILLDGTDIREFDLKSLRRKIGFIGQETLCFNDTVFNNIACAKEGATLGEVAEAAKKAQIHDTLLSLEKQYETFMGDKGARFSGGELQRIALARMFLKNPDILILDEPLNSLDARTQQALRESLQKLTRDRTVLWITHEPPFVDFADRTIHLQNGRIV